MRSEQELREILMSVKPAERQRTLAAMTDRTAWGWGLASVHTSGQVLDTWFPEPRLGPAAAETPPQQLIAAQVLDEDRGVQTETVLVEIELDKPPASTSDG